MKLLIILLFLGAICSCSSGQRKMSVSQMIQDEEFQSLQEIKTHADFLLESHPELDGKVKSELSSFLKAAIQKQQALKEEESKIIQILLKKSLSVNQLTDKQLNAKNDLKKRLKGVYEDKSKNVLSLVNKIVNLSDQDDINDGFRHHMIEFMSRFR
jgi:hypothetical protein